MENNQREELERIEAELQDAENEKFSAQCALMRTAGWMLSETYMHSDGTWFIRFVKRFDGELFQIEAVASKKSVGADLLMYGVIEK